MYQTEEHPSSLATLLLFHGAGLSSMSFAAMVSALPKHMSAWAFDCRGHGGSTVEPEQDWRLDTLVKDAQELLRAEGWLGHAKPCFVVGHSMGGRRGRAEAWADAPP